MEIGDLIDFVALSHTPNCSGNQYVGDGIRFRQVVPVLETGGWSPEGSPFAEMASRIYPGTNDDAIGLVVDFIEEEGNWVILLGTKYLKIANGFAELYLVKNRINQPRNLVR